MIFLYAYTHGGPRFIVSPERLCSVCIEFDFGVISGRAQSLARNSHPSIFIVQELCESRGGRPGLSVLTSLLVSVDVKIY